MEQINIDRANGDSILRNIFAVYFQEDGSPHSFEKDEDAKIYYLYGQDEKDETKYKIERSEDDDPCSFLIPTWVIESTTTTPEEGLEKISISEDKMLMRILKHQERSNMTIKTKGLTNKTLAWCMNADGAIKYPLTPSSAFVCHPNRVEEMQEVYDNDQVSSRVLRGHAIYATDLCNENEIWYVPRGMPFGLYCLRQDITNLPVRQDPNDEESEIKEWATYVDMSISWADLGEVVKIEVI